MYKLRDNVAAKNTPRYKSLQGKILFCFPCQSLSVANQKLRMLFQNAKSHLKNHWLDSAPQSKNAECALQIKCFINMIVTLHFVSKFDLSSAV